jgi:catechol 2,3-dioxygenase-like lactoylglutathione lyase family enzyme
MQGFCGQSQQQVNPPMIDHVTVSVRDLTASKKFYEQAFVSLGYRVAFGKDDIFWAFDLGGGGLFEIQRSATGQPATRVHVAFRAKNRGEVDAFYQAALAAGAKENGPPGLRPDYSETYYACFVLDPDGNNIEAMLK